VWRSVPTGKRLASAGGQLYGNDESGEVIVWDVENGAVDAHTHGPQALGGVRRVQPRWQVPWLRLEANP